MPKKRNAKRKIRKKKQKTKPTDVKQYLIRVCIGLSVLILLVVASGVLMHQFMLRYKAQRSMAPEEKKTSQKIPTYEIFPKEKSIPPKSISRPIRKPRSIPGQPLPQVAIIIDDIGYDRIMAEKFLNLGSSFTFSMLPHGPFTPKMAELAKAGGYEVMLHLPMEPNEYPTIDPGPGALLTSMTPDELIEQLKHHLDFIPGIKGVNNHMGSKLTASSTQMYQIFTILKKRGLYFIDSKTSPESLCKSSARLFKVEYEERDVFIDHLQDPDFIKGQLESLIRIAEKHGTSVGIAHPHEITYQVLNEMLPDIKKRVNIVPASKLVYKPS